MREIKIIKIFVYIITTTILYSCKIIFTNYLSNENMPTISHIDRAISNYTFDYSKKNNQDDIKSFIVKNSKGDDVIINSAVKDSATGQMIAQRELNGIVISAKSHTVSEREGVINLDFMISIPQSLIKSDCQTIFKPFLVRDKDTIHLKSIALSGYNFRKAQKKGYQRYAQYLNSIIPDQESNINDFTYLNDLIIFLDRHLPQSKFLEGKSDSTLQNRDGLTESEIIEYYKKWWLINRNRKRINQIPKIYNRYIKAPYLNDLKLDSIVKKPNGTIMYHYTQQLNSTDKTGKIHLYLWGIIKNSRGLTRKINCTDSLTYYISSMINFIDTTPVYYKYIIPTTKKESYKSNILFNQNSAHIQKTKHNAKELQLIEERINSTLQIEKYKLDSIVITANTSPEGSYNHNKILSQKRANEVKKYIDSIILEGKTYKKSHNINIICNTKVGTEKELKDIIQSYNNGNQLLNNFKNNKITKKEIEELFYSKMRYVKIDFNLSKIGYFADTIYSTQLDTTYLRAINYLKDRDYKNALDILIKYKDINCAIAYMSLGKDNSALEILDNLKATATNYYLKSIIYSRKDSEKKAVEYFILATDLNPTLYYRAILDPEISFLIKKYNLKYNEL